MSKTNQFYNTEKYEHTTNPYTQQIFEASPLNRVLKQAAQGDSWKVIIGSENDHTIKTDWTTNLTEEVVHYEVAFIDENTQKPTLVKKGFYPAESLYVTVIKDENWTPQDQQNHTTREYKNKRGQIILKRTYANNIPHDTYYVYDFFNNLTFILPPQSHANLFTTNGNSYALNPQVLNDYGYQYKYDLRNRLIEKKIAGKGWEYIVYNKVDLPILTQDANLKEQNKWLFTKYDALGRVAYTGIYQFIGKIGVTRNILQGLYDQQQQQFENRIEEPIIINGIEIYYSNTITISGTYNTELLTINYYDNYELPTIVSLNPNTTNITWEGMTATGQVKGLATVNQVRVLDTDKWITTTNYYDNKGRLWETHIKNDYLGIDDWMLTKLDFVGKPLKTFTKHIKDGNLFCITDDYTYDHQGRLLTQDQSVNGAFKERIVSNHYDELGQLVQKGIGGKTHATQRLQTIDYSYNIRGWLKAINDVDLLGNDLFGFNIKYDTQVHGATPLYNGNIAETEWKTSNDNTKRWYRYNYDALNRITQAIDNSNNYKLSNVSYDKNGNILNLERTGHINEAATSFGMMDDLTYTYSGNQLLGVTDQATIQGFRDVNTTGNDFFYDANGNLSKDLNKGIESITYNHLNLPTVINFNSSNHTGTLQYVYDATGAKIKKIASQDGNTTAIETVYSGNFVYKNDELEFYSTPEGYAEPVSTVNTEGTPITGAKYTYQYKDHLGNIRLSYEEQEVTNVTGYETTFDDGIASPWVLSSNSTSIEIPTSGWDQGWLVIKTKKHLNGVNGYYDLQAGITYDIEIPVDRADFSSPLEFSIWKGNSKKYGDHYVALNVHQEYIRVAFTPEETGTHRLNLRMRDNGYSGENQTFRLNYVTITPQESSSLLVKEEKNYYPFGIQHKGYNPLIRGRKHNYGYNGKEQNNELGLDWYDFGARNYDMSIGRWFNIDNMSEDYVEWNPYNYTLNNPIYFIDPDGNSAQDLWAYNVDTNQLEWVDDTGGSDVQIVQVTNNEGENLGGATVAGSKVYIARLENSVFVSSYDATSDIAEGYNANSGYNYTGLDLKKRHELKELGGVFWGLILEAEANGQAIPIHSKTAVSEYIKQWKTNSAFWYGAQHYYMPEGGSRGVLSRGYNAVRKQGRTLENILEGSKSNARQAIRNSLKKSIIKPPAYKSISAQTTSKSGSISNAVSGGSSQTQASKIKNSWNQFLHANKGKYSGKNWIKQAAKDYKSLKSSTQQ